MAAKIDGLLARVVQLGCSDLHLKSNNPPAVRKDGNLIILRNENPIAVETMQALLEEIVPPQCEDAFKKGNDVDFAYSAQNGERFRINVFRQRGSISMAARHISSVRQSFEELGLPPIVQQLANERRGLVLVTGTAGSGKTTTLASMLDYINRTRPGHIVTVEDPIEVLHEDVNCVFNQREIGLDVETYGEALRHVVRQDPNIIFIGEMRDAETVGTALTAAEIGNLVLSTLHTIDATETINRIIDFYPPHQQHQARIMLASTLRGIISMRLLPAVGGGRVPAVEVLVMTGTIREYILDPEQTYKIRDVLQDGEYYGMQNFDQSLIQLLTAGKITVENALATAVNVHDFKIKLRQMNIATPTENSQNNTGPTL